MPRIAPAEAPYEAEIATALQRIMPPGVEPLVLFRTMARSPRVFQKMFAGGLLDKGPLSLRQREIVIDRTTARLGCEYEWGVHIAFFADKVGFGTAEIDAIVSRQGALFRAAFWQAVDTRYRLPCRPVPGGDTLIDPTMGEPGIRRGAVTVEASRSRSRPALSAP